MLCVVGLLTSDCPNALSAEVTLECSVVEYPLGAGRSMLKDPCSHKIIMRAATRSSVLLLRLRFYCILFTECHASYTTHHALYAFDDKTFTLCTTLPYCALPYYATLYCALLRMVYNAMPCIVRDVILIEMRHTQLHVTSRRWQRCCITECSKSYQTAVRKCDLAQYDVVQL